MSRAAARSAASWGIMAAVVVAIAVVGVRHAREVGATLQAVSLWPVLGAALLHAGTLALRSEAWRIGLRAVGGAPLPGGVVHRANALAFLVGTVQGELSLPARVAALRRAAPGRAPSAAQTALVDLPLALVEIAGLFAFAAIWEPWLLAGTVVVAAALPLLARGAAGRPAGSPLRGLIVATDPPALARLVAVMSGVVLISALRIWLLLLAFHLPAGPESVAKVVAAVTVIGVLPIGVGTGPAATIASLSAGPAAVATTGVAFSAGLSISATSVLGVVLYAAVVWGAAARRAVAARPAAGRRAAARARTRR